MNSKQFLQIGGILLVLVAILGFANVLGPTADKSIFHSTWWFDKGENWTHLILGIVALVAAFALPASVQRPLVMLLGIIGVVIGVYSFFRQTFLGSNLENPADSILHLVLGLWALWASMKNGVSRTTPAPMNPANPVTPTGM